MGKTLYTRIKEQFDADPEALPAEVARHCNTGLGLVLSIRAQLARDRQDRPAPGDSGLVPASDGDVAVDGRDLEVDVRWHKLPAPAAFVEISAEDMEQAADTGDAITGDKGDDETGQQAEHEFFAARRRDWAEQRKPVAVDDMKPGQRAPARLELDPRVAAQVITEAPAGSYVARSPELREFASSKVAILPDLPNVGGQGDGMKSGEARLTLDPAPVAVVDLSALQAAITLAPAEVAAESKAEDDWLSRPELLELVARLTAENLRLRRLVRCVPASRSTAS